MPAVVFAGSKVKALKDRLSLNDTTEIISVNADPSSGAGVAAPLGSIAMDYLAGKVYKKTGSVDTEWQELGAGLGGINYIENPDAESGTTGWATYADAAGSQPVDGTGGTANITWSRSTTSPLRGVADFNLVKDAVNRQGQGVSYDFTIDSADQAKILTISFDYEVLSGTYASGDLAVYVIQDPAGTPVVLQPAGYQVEAATVGNKVREVATFQTASNVTSYRLCIHVASTSASAYSLAIDNVSVSPQQVVYGAPVTDWQDFPSVAAGTLITGLTTNPTFGTIDANIAQWRRVGGDMEIRWNFRQTTAGTAGSGVYLFNLPPGYQIDSSKVKFPSPGNGTLAHTVSGPAGVAGSGNQFTGYVAIWDATRLFLSVGNEATNPTQFGSSYGQNFSTTQLMVGFVAKVPILGWSSSVVVSSSTDTRVVAARYSSNGGQALTANVTNIPFSTLGQDTHSAWNGTVFTAPVPGFYQVQGAVNYTTAPVNSINAYVDGVSFARFSPYMAVAYQSFSGGLFLNAGQQLSFRTDANSTLSPGGINNYIFISRVSGPSQIAASETVAARFSTSATQSLTTTPAIINFATISYDTHGAVTTGASWKFTAPISGRYRVSARFLTAAGTTAMRIGYDLYKNGVAVSTPVTGTQQTTASNRIDGSGSDEILLNAGDYIDLRGATTTGTNSLAGDAPTNFITIVRIGN